MMNAQPLKDKKKGVIGIPVTPFFTMSKSVEREINRLNLCQLCSGVRKEEQGLGLYFRRSIKTFGGSGGGGLG